MTIRASKSTQRLSRAEILRALCSTSTSCRYISLPLIEGNNLETLRSTNTLKNISKILISNYNFPASDWMLQGLLCNSKCGTDPCSEAEFDRCRCEIWISHVISKTNANIIIKKSRMQL